MGSQTALQITVGGHWMSLECQPGDIAMSTVWPGGSDELSWSLGTQVGRRFKGGELVVVYYGGVRVWAGTLLEPDPSQDQLTAQGLWRLGDNFAAMNAGVGTAIPDQAIDNAIALGLQWARPASISSSATAIDISQGPVNVGPLLDMWADNNTSRWAVNPYGEVYGATDPTTPTYQTLPLDGGLGYALDNYASFLWGRFVNSVGVYGTVGRSDTDAEALHGHKEDVLDLTDRGALTSTTAGNILTSLLALGRSTPQWTESIDFTYGELLTMGGVPVALETVAAGTVLRVHGGFELAMRQNGAMYVDVLIGQTNLAGGTLTLQPFQVATRSYTDVLADALKKK